MSKRTTLAAASMILTLVACGASQPDESSQQSSSELKQCTVIALCIRGYVWDAHTCKCVPEKTHGGKPGSCSSDADCRLFSDYCTGCDCRALSSNQQDPTCSGPGVRCLVDPCGGHAAACVNGACAVQ